MKHTASGVGHGILINKCTVFEMCCEFFELPVVVSSVSTWL